MREIKFRAWDKKRLMMVGVDHISFNEKYIIVSPGFEWNKDPETGEAECQLFLRDCELMQFTSLLDKNGKEIYEGDVCRYQWQYRSKQTVSSVVFENGAFSFLEKNDLEKQRNQGGQLVRVSNCSKLEVIGNIYENPELLKG